MKKIVQPYVEFLGSNATEVTGSANLLRFLDYSILIDYGLRQTTNDEEDYKVNSKRHKDVKPKYLTAIILTHIHSDHCGMIPALYKDGADCPVYVPKGCKQVLQLMWNDTEHIFTKDYERFDRKPLYSQEDIEIALHHIVEIDLHEKFHINEHISFEYYNAKHVVKARQVYMELSDGVTIKKVGFTGDVSNSVANFYLDNYEPLPYVNLLVGESTYANSKRLNKTKDRNKDCDKIDYAIKTAISNKGKVLIPVFSLDRLQNILTTIYTMYNGKPPIKILVDSPLGYNISNVWDKVIDKNLELWLEIKNSNDIRWIKEYKDSMSYMAIDEPMLIIAGGGFLKGGRATAWTKELIPNGKNIIVFCGYSSPDSVAGMIKSGKQKIVNIDGKNFSIKSSVIVLNSFSSHMDYKELKDMYTTLMYTKLALVHGNFDNKVDFANELKQELSKLNRTSRVVAVQKDTKIHF